MSNDETYYVMVIVYDEMNSIMMWVIDVVLMCIA